MLYPRHGEMKSLQEIIVFTNEKEALQYIVTLVHILQNDRFKLDRFFLYQIYKYKRMMPWSMAVHFTWKVVIMFGGQNLSESIYVATPGILYWEQAAWCLSRCFGLQHT